MLKWKNSVTPVTWNGPLYFFYFVISDFEDDVIKKNIKNFARLHVYIYILYIAQHHLFDLMVRSRSKASSILGLLDRFDMLVCCHTLEEVRYLSSPSTPVNKLK